MNAISQTFHDALVHTFPKGPTGLPLYPARFCEWMNRIDDWVHSGEYECCWVPPFGFVPEAGCPDHD